MTELIFQNDSYVQSFDAKITQVDNQNHGVVLDRTSFFSGGGGQPADFGFLANQKENFVVKRAQRIAGKLVHLIDGDHLPELGSQIKGQINWDHRYKLMRTHTAMHIFCGVIFRDYGASVTGGNMEPLKGRMDFEFETMQRELVDEINANINAEVANARAVSWRELPREEAFLIPDLIRTKINLLPKGIQYVRIVEIKGLDLQADGGTHVRNTSEIGKIRVIDYKSKGKINKRIYVELSD